MSKPKLIEDTEALVDILRREKPKCILLVECELPIWDVDTVTIKHIQTSDVLEEELSTLKHRDSIRAVLDTLDISLDIPIIVGSKSVQRAAVIAAAILSLECQNVSLCTFKLDERSLKWVVDAQPGLVELRDNSFDVSPIDSCVEVDEGINVDLKKTMQAYEALFSGTSTGKLPSTDYIELDLDAARPCWNSSTKRLFFEMPSALSRNQFLQITNNILCYASFALAPFGLPDLIRKRYTCAEFLSQTQVLVQDILEVCSDVAYEEFGVDETSMALSLHKWTEEVRDPECIEQIKAIGRLAQTLFELPRVVEIPLHLTSQDTSSFLEKLYKELKSRIHVACPWALHLPFDRDGPNACLGAEHTSKDEEDEWKCMYAGVAHSLLYIPQKKNQSLQKLSSLQQRTLIQVVAESAQSIFKTGYAVSMVQVQALIEATQGNDEQGTIRTGESKYSFYAVIHTLSSSLEAEEVDFRLRENTSHFVEQGDMLYHSKNYDEAILRYSEALLELPLFHSMSCKAIVGKAKCFFKKGDTSIAEELCRVSLQLDQFDNGAYDCLAGICEESNDYSNALQNYVLSFVVQGSRSLEAADSIDRVAKLIGRHTARTYFDEMQKDSRLPASWLVASYFEAFVHDIDYGIALHIEVSKHLDIESNALSTEMLYHRAIFNKRNQHYDKAYSDVQAIITREMADDMKASVLNLHSSFLYIVGDVNAAIDTIEQSLEINVCVNSLIKKAAFMSELGDFEEAYRLCDEALLLDPTSPDACLHKGQTALLQGDYLKAVEWLRRAMARSLAIPIVYVIYATALYRSGSAPQANDTFHEACALFSTSVEVHLFYGEVLADQGNYAQAMQHFVQAHNILPDCPLPFLNAGRVYVATNNPLRAVEHFNQALIVDARCSSAHLDIAQVLFAQGKTAQAFHHFDVAVECCRFLPEIEEVYSSRAVASAQLKATDILGVDLRHMMRQK